MWGLPIFRATAVCVALAVLCVSLGSAAERFTWEFTDSVPGRPPDGFAFESTERAGNGRWEVVSERGNHVLAQLAPARPRGYRMALAEPRLRDLSLAVRLKAAGGARTAGLVWRHQDEGRFYLAQLDLREQKVSVYRVMNGNRSRLESEDDLELEPEAWHRLKVEHRGELIRVWVNGVPVGRARDRAIAEGGRFGVWITAATAGSFDDLVVERRER